MNELQKQLLMKIEELEKQIIKSNEKKLEFESLVYKNTNTIKDLTDYLLELKDRLHYLYFINVIMGFIIVILFFTRGHQLEIVLWVFLVIILGLNLFVGVKMLINKFKK